MMASDSVRQLPSSSSSTGRPPSGFFLRQELRRAVLPAQDVDRLQRNLQALLGQVDAKLLRIRRARRSRTPSSRAPPVAHRVRAAIRPTPRASRGKRVAPNRAPSLDRRHASGAARPRRAARRCARRPTACPAPDLLGGGKLVVYTPLGYAPGVAWRPRGAALRADAEDLARLGFRAVVTERTTPALEADLPLLQAARFVSVIVGVAIRPTPRSCGRRARCGAAPTVRRRQRWARHGPARAEAAVAGCARTGRPVAARAGRVVSRRSRCSAWDWVFPIAAADPTRAQEAAEHHGATASCSSADRRIVR